LGRLIGIDFGTKRVGIAVTDPLKISAHGLQTVHAKDAISFIKDYAKNENIEKFIVGMPKKLNNEPSQSAEQLKPFIDKLKEQLPGIPVEYIDERFTSKMAQQTMVMAGLKKKKRQDKAMVDTISATIILQSYLVALRKRQ